MRDAHFDMFPPGVPVAYLTRSEGETVTHDSAEAALLYARMKCRIGAPVEIETTFRNKTPLGPIHVKTIARY